MTPVELISIEINCRKWACSLLFTRRSQLRLIESQAQPLQINLLSRSETLQSAGIVSQVRVSVQRYKTSHSIVTDLHYVGVF